MSTWPSMTTAVSPSPLSIPMRPRVALAVHCSKPCAITPASAFTSSVSSPTMAAPTTLVPSSNCVAVSACHIAVPGLTRPEPTARRNASFRPRCASGPMHVPTKPRNSVVNTSSPGSTNTTGTDHMPLWATGCLSAGCLL